MARKHHDASSVRLHLDGQVTLRQLGDALEAWTDLLREVAADVAGVQSRDAVRFVVTEAKAGSFDLSARPQPAARNVSPAIMPRISKTLTAGLKSLERRATRPKHFTDKALLSVRELGRLASPETPTISVGNGAEPIALSQRMLVHVDEVLAPEFTSIGTIEGKLEGLIVHGKSRFLIFDPITGRQVTCFFGARTPYETVLAMFGRRVAVTGVIRSRRSGEKVDIHVTSLQTLPDDAQLPSVADVRGILKAAN
jgi:hypothetical protein